MSPRCTICGRADRGAIDADVAAGAGSLATIATRYNVSKSALLRHRDNHGSTPSPTSPTVAEPVAHRCDAAGAAVVLDDTEPLPDHLEDVDPSTARLREVADLLARGMTRAEIASRYRVHVDTVTVWTRAIREKGINRVRATTAEGIIADLLQANAQRKRLLWQTVQDAQAQGVHRTVIRALDALRKEDHHVFEIAQSLGAFDRFKLSPEMPKDEDDYPGAVSARLLREGARSILGMMAAFDHAHSPSDVDPQDPQTRLEQLCAETPDETEDDDEEPLF